MNRKLKRGVALKSAVFLVIAGFGVPAHASWQPLNFDPLQGLGGNGNKNPLSQLINPIFQQVNDLFGKFEPKTELNIGQYSVAIGTDIAPILKDITGVLGLPDPTKTRPEMQNKANFFSNGLVDNVSETASKVKSEIVAANTASVLGVEGQNKSSQQRQALFDSVNQVRELASICQQKVVTQEVMKCQMEQNAHLANIVGSDFALSQQRHATEALMGDTLNDIAQHNTREETEKARDRMAASFKEMQGYAVLSRLNMSAP